MSTKAKTYTNGEVSIVWKADLCYHSKNCINHLPEVFDVKQRPWINAQGASTEKIIETVKKCPSGALTYKMNSELEADQPQESLQVTQIQVADKGPLIIEGSFQITDKDGGLIEKMDKAALCRCGASKKKPFCDGSHRQIEFD